MSLIREALTELSDLSRLTEIAVVDDMVNYHNRQNDKSTIKDSIKDRYGVGIKKSDDPTSSAPLETYTREGFDEQVDAGLIEALSGGFGPKIYGALATLFTERGQKYTLTHETTEDVEAAEELLNEHRTNGGYNATMAAADKLSIQVGSSAVFMSFARDSVQYQKFSPADVTVYYNEYITEDDERRLVNQTDLEDCTAIRIRLSQVDAKTWNYLAIFGRSEIYPQGRYVQYQADSTGGEVPPVGSPDAIDWTPENSTDVGNPLSVYANENEDEGNLPEYPLAIIKSGTTESGDAMPVSTSLYTDCLEIDVATSHLLSTSQDSASGTLVIERNAQGRNHPLPRSLTGKVVLDDGQEAKRVDSDSTASIDGVQVMKDLMVQIASGYGVPDYMAVSEDHMLEAASGVSLAIKTRPLVMARNDRVELNKPVVGKIFTVEKALIELHAEGNDSDVSLLKECTQTWDAGELKLPENKKEKTERNIALKDAGGIDTIEFIRRENDLLTDEEAIAEYEKYRDRAKKYPSLIQPEEPAKPKPGLNLRGQGIAPKQ